MPRIAGGKIAGTAIKTVDGVIGAAVAEVIAGFAKPSAIVTTDNIAERK